MAHHSFAFDNPEARELLRSKKIDPHDFILATVKGKPAKTKGECRIEGRRVTLFGSSFVAKGYLKH